MNASIRVYIPHLILGHDVFLYLMPILRLLLLLLPFHPVRATL